MVRSRLQMIKTAEISDILSTYEKYGWQLRRVLLTKELKESIDGTDLFGKMELFDSDIDAAWFSRPPTGKSVAWEIRHLSALPYALLEQIDESSSDSEEKLRAVELRLHDAVSRRRSA